mgnify:CR=1 FL=1
MFIQVRNLPCGTTIEDVYDLFCHMGIIDSIHVSDALARGIQRKSGEGAAESVDTTDGVSLAFADWRFNLRASNTEPVIRLNVETRGDTQLMQDKRDELLALLDELQA